jgi:hypothetical protein
MSGLADAQATEINFSDSLDVPFALAIAQAMHQLSAPAMN